MSDTAADRTAPRMPATRHRPAGPRELLTLEELTNRAGDERAQHPLLHDQGAGAAADPARPLGLLHLRPRGAARAGAGAAEPRVHARPRSSGTSPTSPPTPLPRTSRCTARCWRRGRPTRPIEMTRAELEQRAGRAARRRRPDHAGGARDRLPDQARAVRGGGLPAQRRPRPARPRLPDRGRDRGRATCTPRTAARSPRSSTSCSAPWCGRSTRSPGARPEKLREVVERLKPLSVAQPGRGVRERDGRDQARGHR